MALIATKGIRSGPRGGMARHGGVNANRANYFYLRNRADNSLVGPSPFLPVIEPLRISRFFATEKVLVRFIST